MHISRVKSHDINVDPIVILAMTPDHLSGTVVFGNYHLCLFLQPFSIVYLSILIRMLCFHYFCLVLTFFSFLQPFPIILSLRQDILSGTIILPRYLVRTKVHTGFSHYPPNKFWPEPATDYFPIILPINCVWH